MAEELRKVKCREDLSRGDDVNVVVRYGPEGSLIKRKRARVVDVLRKAAILRDIEGEKRGTRTVTFQELELIVEVPDAVPQLPQLPKKKKRRTSKDRAPEPVPPAPVVVSSSVESAPTLSDWIANGVKVQEQLIKQAHGIENEVSALRAQQQKLDDESLRIADEANSKQRDLDAIRAKIAALDTLRGQVG